MCYLPGFLTVSLEELLGGDAENSGAWSIEERLEGLKPPVLPCVPGAGCLEVPVLRLMLVAPEQVAWLFWELLGAA